MMLKWLMAPWLLVVADFVPPPPTGPHPRFIAQLPKLKADWAQLVSDAAAKIQPATSWYTYLQNHATSDAAVPSPWLTRHTITMYQITGASKWGQLAWQSALGNFINKYPNYTYSCCKTSYTCCRSDRSYGGDNSARIIAGLWVDTYDWIYTYLNSTQRTHFRQKLANLMDYLYRGGGNCCSYNQYSNFPLRSTDTDVTVDNYFTFLKYYAATADEHPHAASYWKNASYNLGGVNPLPISSLPGGRCGNNCYNKTDLRINMRTSVKALLLKYAAGGTGIASTGYNLEGQMNKVAYDWAGCRTAFGVDYFPEIPENLLRWGMHYMSLATPDLQWIYRWGDDEAGTEPLGALFNDLSVISATTSWFFTDPRQAQMRSFLNRTWSLWSAKHWAPYNEFFYAYQHLRTATTADFKPALPSHSGNFSWDIMGTGTYRTGWTAQDSLFGFEWQPFSEIDHFTQHVGNFQLYKKGEWLVYTPISYGAPTSSGEVTNTMSFYGWPDGRNYNNIQEFKGMLDAQFSRTSAFFVGANAGTNRYAGAWYTPPTWQQEFTRSVLYVPGSSVDVILVFDRSNIIDPRTAANWNVNNWWGYNPSVANMFSTRPRKLWQWHAPFQPTITNNTVFWPGVKFTGDNWNGFAPTASTTQGVTLKAHFTSTKFAVTKETGLPSSGSFYWSSDQSGGFLVTETCSIDQAFDATVHVLFAGSKTATFASKSYSSKTLIGRAVVVSRQGDNDIMAVFNAQVGATIPSNNCGVNGGSACSYDPAVPKIVPKQHLFKSSDCFTFLNVSISTATLQLYLHDLNSANSQYYLFVDRAFNTTVTGIPASGFKELQLTGLVPGTHTFCLQPFKNCSCGVVP